MASKLLVSLSLAVTGRAGAGVLVFVGLTFFGTASSHSAALETRPARTVEGAVPCWSGPVPEGVEPCGLFNQARRLFSQVTRSAADYLQSVAQGFELERSLRLQQGLLREDLVWQDRGLTRRQIDLIVFVAVALSLDRVEKQSVELRAVVDSDPKATGRLHNIERYSSQALVLLQELSARLRDVPDYELRFYF
ncbi:MAG: hypothetical protein ACE5JI_00145 [Acidobacteriota bacterium]